MLYSNLFHVIQSMRDTIDHLVLAAELESNVLTEHEQQIKKSLHKVKCTLLEEMSHVPSESIDSITEASAFSKLRDMAYDIKRQYDRLITKFSTDFTIDMISDLTDEDALRKIIRYNFYVEVFEKLGMYDVEETEVSYENILYRLDAIIRWSIKDVNSHAPKNSNCNMTALLVNRWRREVVQELNQIYGLADPCQNKIVDLYSLVLDSIIRINSGVKKKEQ